MSQAKRGGARANAGRHKIDPRLLKVPVSYKLPTWLVEWLRAQAKSGHMTSAAELIEDALRVRHGLTPPDVARPPASDSKPRRWR